MRIVLRICPELPSVVTNNSTSTNNSTLSTNNNTISSNSSISGSEQDDNAPLYFFEGTSYDNLTIYEKNVRQNGKTYSIDHVYDPSTSQFELYSIEVSPFVNQIFEGQDVFILLMGDSNQARKYIFEGPNDHPGVFYRSVDSIFQTILNNDYDEPSTYKISISCVALTNGLGTETFKDLLSPSNDKIKIKELEKRGFVLEGQTQQIIKNPLQALEVFHNSKLEIQNLYESHIVVSIHLEKNSMHQISSLKTKKVVGTLQFVLLAHPKLGQNRASLFNWVSPLYGCLDALETKMPVVPFHKSKLTMFLRDSLLGNKLSTCLHGLSPTKESYKEVISSLNISSKFKQCIPRSTFELQFHKLIKQHQITGVSPHKEFSNNSSAEVESPRSVDDTKHQESRPKFVVQQEYLQYNMVPEIPRLKLPQKSTKSHHIDESNEYLVSPVSQEQVQQRTKSVNKFVTRRVHTESALSKSMGPITNGNKRSNQQDDYRLSSSAGAKEVKSVRATTPNSSKLGAHQVSKEQEKIVKTRLVKEVPKAAESPASYLVQHFQNQFSIGSPLKGTQNKDIYSSVMEATIKKLKDTIFELEQENDKLKKSCEAKEKLYRKEKKEAQKYAKEYLSAKQRTDEMAALNERLFLEKRDMELRIVKLEKRKQMDNEEKIETEEKQKQEYEELQQENHSLREEISNLRTDIGRVNTLLDEKSREVVELKEEIQEMDYEAKEHDRKEQELQQEKISEKEKALQIEVDLTKHALKLALNELNSLKQMVATSTSGSSSFSQFLSVNTSLRQSQRPPFLKTESSLEDSFLQQG